MFDEGDQRYFAMRARSSHARAAAAGDLAIRRTHQKLAKEYEGKVAAISHLLATAGRANR